jgi:hypothetical protein
MLQTLSRASGHIAKQHVRLVELRLPLLINDDSPHHVYAHA